MKEDILEQLVDGWFLRQPATFTKHNVKYKPNPEDIAHLSVKERSQYTVSSDIDVLAIHLDKEGADRVSVVSCKSWQEGFDIDLFFENLCGLGDKNKRIGNGPIWKKFRELTEKNWAKAFRDKVFGETHSHDFTYYIAVTKIINKRDKHKEEFKRCQEFLDNLSDGGKHCIKIDFITLEDMIRGIFNEKSDTTLEATEIGRFMQLIKAANLSLVTRNENFYRTEFNLHTHQI